jgi:hypothetical protein
MGWARFAAVRPPYDYQREPRDVERRVALAVLLAQPDAPELHRGSRPLLGGRTDRHTLVPYLTATYVQAKLLEWREREHTTAETTPSGEPAAARPANAGTHIAFWDLLRQPHAKNGGVITA